MPEALDLPRLRPLWRPDAVPSTFRPLDRALDVDVVIAGAGITGLTLAYQLKSAGLRVAVLEMRSVGMGATGHTSGHLTAALDVGWDVLIRRFGELGALEAARSSMSAIDFIEKQVDEHGIDCDFHRVDGWRYTEESSGAGALQNELVAARKVGLTADWSETGPFPFAKGALRFANQARFHPVAYVSALASLVHGDGSFVFEDTRVESIVDGAPCVVQAGAHQITAAHVVHATHTPLGVVLPLQARIAPYMSYAMVIRLEGPVPGGLYWDTATPYHYLRPVVLPDGGEALLVGGEDHKTGQETHTGERFSALEAYVRDRFPTRSVEFRWMWEVFEPVDGLPYVGRLGQSQAVWGATGLSGNGLTLGTAAGINIAAQIVAGHEGSELSVFRPQRYKPLASAGAFIRENKNVAWRIVRDRLDHPTAPGLETVKPGAGGLVEMECKKLAVYRSRSGHVTILSSVCPHAGGIVQWNEAARTWDCPLHGSRFTATGQLVAGPAVSGLLPAPDTFPLGEECSISGLISDLEAGGYTCNFQPTAERGVRCGACGVESPASAGRIEAFHRFEGMSDPDDMCVVVAMRLPRNDGGDPCRGILVLGFGPTASLDERETFAALKFDPSAQTQAC